MPPSFKSIMSTLEQLKYEIELLREPKADSDIVALVDIVFVHGILGDYKSAWTDAETGILWPRDLLPGHIPPSRILTFNYSPDFNDFFADDEDGPSQVAQHSRGLDLALHLFRAETKTSDRPIILVAHSLGGLVCAQALVESRELAANIRAIIFFATPFILPDEGGWEALAARMSKLAGSQSQSKHGPPSGGFQYRHLGNIVKSLSKYVEDESSPLPRMIFFGETDVMDSLDSCVVGKGEYVLPIEDEDIYGNVCEAQDIEGDHISICKYDMRSCSGYQRVRGKLAQILGDTRGLRVHLGPRARPDAWVKQCVD